MTLSRKNGAKSPRILPNFIFDLGLDAYTLKVYLYILNEAYENPLSISIRDLSDKLEISKTCLNSCLNRLINGENKLNLILIKKNVRKGWHGGSLPTEFELVTSDERGE